MLVTGRAKSEQEVELYGNRYDLVLKSMLERQQTVHKELKKKKWRRKIADN